MVGEINDGKRKIRGSNGEKHQKVKGKAKKNNKKRKGITPKAIKVSQGEKSGKAQPGKHQRYRRKNKKTSS